jgi:hypothetical protein
MSYPRSAAPGKPARCLVWVRRQAEAIDPWPQAGIIATLRGSGGCAPTPLPPLDRLSAIFLPLRSDCSPGGAITVSVLRHLPSSMASPCPATT